jgi:hypothetical protein
VGGIDGWRWHIKGRMVVVLDRCPIDALICHDRDSEIDSIFLVLVICVAINYLYVSVSDVDKLSSLVYV